MAHVTANTEEEKVSMTKLKQLFGVEKQDRGPKTPSGVTAHKSPMPKVKNETKYHTQGGGTGAPYAKGAASTKFKDKRGVQD